MIYNKFFPFYERSLTSAPKMAAVHRDRIWFPPQVVDSPLAYKMDRMFWEDQEKWATAIKGMLATTLPRQIPMHKIDPLNVYVPNLATPELAVFATIVRNIRNGENKMPESILRSLGIDAERGTIDCKVTQFDYDTICSDIALAPPPEGEDGSSQAYYWAPEGLMSQPVADVRPLKYAQGYGVPMDNVHPYIFHDMQGLELVGSEEDLEHETVNEYHTAVDQPQQAVTVPAPATANDSAFFDDEDYYLALADKMEALLSEGPEVIQISDADDDFYAEIAARGDEKVEVSPDKLKSPIVFAVEEALQADQEGQYGIPCLTGLSGVSKSSIVQDIARRNGWRMVDFRAAFLHRLDMEGMFYLTDEDGKPLDFTDTEHAKKFTAQAYFSDFTRCSDQYMDFAQRMAARLKVIQDSDSDDEENYAIKQNFIAGGTFPQLGKLIEKYEEESRPALLFFDEIVRAQMKILNLFTTLLNTRRFGTLTFNECKMVAAANTPHGMDDWTDGKELFKGQSSEDPAVFNRLKIVPVKPQDQYGGWLKYIKGAGWHKLVVDFITKHPTEDYESGPGSPTGSDPSVAVQADRAYMVSFLNSDEDATVKRMTAYPTFRAWEMIHKIMTHYDRGNPKGTKPEKPGFITKEQIKGVLGPHKLTKTFISYLETNGIVFPRKSPGPNGKKVSEDQASALLEANIMCGNAAGLFGPSGMGKTFRVKGICDAQQHEMIEIQLSQKDPASLMGAPTMSGIGEYLSEFALERFKEETGIDEPAGVEDIVALANEVAIGRTGDPNDHGVEGLPDRVTTRAPDNLLHQRIKTVRRKRMRQAREKLGITVDDWEAKPYSERLKLSQEHGHTKLVLFFDECNRIPEGSESVQSAMFEAVSDHRFAGVQFHPNEISTVCAANIDQPDVLDSDGNIKDSETEELVTTYGEKPRYNGVIDIDSAFLLRMSSYFKADYSKADVRSTRKYMTRDETQFHPALVELLTRKDASGEYIVSDSTLLKWMRSSEYKSEMNNVPSVRAMDALSSKMRTRPNMWSGSFFFPDDEIRTAFNLKVMSASSGAEQKTEILKFMNKPNVIANWVVKSPDYRDLPVQFKGQIVSPEYMMNFVATAVEDLNDAITHTGMADRAERIFELLYVATQTIREVEEAVQDRRAQVISMDIGGVGAGGSDESLGARDLILSEIARMGSDMQRMSPQAIMDRNTAARWVEQTYNEFSDPHHTAQSVGGCLDVLNTMKRYDEIGYVLIEVVLQGQDTATQAILELVSANSDQILSSLDDHLAKFNKEFVEAVKKSPQRHLTGGGEDWNHIVASVMSAP